MTGKLGSWSSYAFILGEVVSYDYRKFQSGDLDGTKIILTFPTTYSYEN